MLAAIEQILYTDPQAEKEAGECPVCGGLMYPPGMHCARCGGDGL